MEWQQDQWQKEWHHEDRAIVKTLARHGMRVQGQLTNNIMYTFLQEVKKHNCKIHLGNKQWADLIAKIWAYNSHTPTIQEPGEDDEHEEEEEQEQEQEVVEEGMYNDQLEREEEDGADHRACHKEEAEESDGEEEEADDYDDNDDDDNKEEEGRTMPSIMFRSVPSTTTSWHNAVHVACVPELMPLALNFSPAFIASLQSLL
jgi:hypothetical protein